MPKPPAPPAHRIEQHDLQGLSARAWQDNPRRHDLEAIAASVKRFGYVQAIVVDDTSGLIVAGHGVLAALLLAHQDGQAPPERVVQDGPAWKVPVLHVTLPEGEAKPYAISDSRTRELGGWMDEQLLGILTELQAGGDSLEGIGFNQQDLDVLQARVGGEMPASFNAVPDADPVNKVKTVTCPHCGDSFTL